MAKSNGPTQPDYDVAPAPSEGTDGTIILGKVTQTLPVKLSHAELYQMDRQRCDAWKALDDAEQDEKLRRDEAKARIKLLDAEHRRLARICGERAEPRQVEVRVYGDHETNTATYVRQDTYEAVRERAMTPEELARCRQLEMLPPEPLGSQE